MEIEFQTIGVVKNDVDEKKDSGWGKDISKIIVDENYSDGLKGLEEFSHVIVIYYLDKAEFELKKHILRRPRNREDMPLIGIFAQRAKDRPNPIGITSVKLVSVNKNVITVKGLDAINGTPVLDIKPYFPLYDCRSEATVPQWVSLLMENYF